MSEMYGFWFETDGRRLERLKPFELEEAKRLFHKHADIRMGNVRAIDYDFLRHRHQLARELASPDSSGHEGKDEPLDDYIPT